MSGSQQSPEDDRWKSARGRLFGDGFAGLGGRLLSGFRGGFDGSDFRRGGGFKRRFLLGDFGGRDFRSGGGFSHRFRGQLTGQGRLHRRFRSAQVDARIGLAGGQAVEDGVGDQVAIKLQSAGGVVITRDRIGDAVRIKALSPPANCGRTSGLTYTESA